MSTIEYSCGHQVSAHSGQAMPMQCACGEGEIVGAKGQFYMTAKPLQVDEWDGAGRPPVGCICEAVWLEPPDGGGIDFESVHIKAYFGSQVWFDSQSLDDVVCEIRDGEFRPIRTQAQREREEVIDCASKAIETAHGSDGSAYKEYCQTLYDAGMLRRAGE